MNFLRLFSPTESPTRPAIEVATPRSGRSEALVREALKGPLTLAYAHQMFPGMERAVLVNQNGQRISVMAGILDGKRVVDVEAHGTAQTPSAMLRLNPGEAAQLLGLLRRAAAEHRLSMEPANLTKLVRDLARAEHRPFDNDQHRDEAQATLARLTERLAA